MLPNKLILFCEEYKIKRITKDEMSKLDKTGKNTEGMIDFNRKIIYILKDSKEASEKDILWHELGHYFSKITESQDNEASAQIFSELIRGVERQLK